MKKFIQKLFIITTGLLIVACGSDNDDTIKEKSISEAYFTKTSSNLRDTYFLYNLGNVVNNSWIAEVSVNGYNNTYNYEVKIKGEVTEEEYTLPLQFSKTDDSNTNISILSFDRELFKAKVDTYKAFIVEKDSNTELEITIPPSSPNRPYIMVDGDEDGFLYSFFFSSERNTSSSILDEINIPTRQRFDFFFAGSWALANNSTISVEIYNTSLSKLGEVATTSFITSNNVKGYSLLTQQLDNIIPNTSEYFLRVKGSSNNGLKYSPYLKINVIK